jgi:anti-anti-sigma regulatory factor
MVVDMGTIAVRLKIDGERVIQTLHEAMEKLGSVEGEATVDFSSVLRIDSSALKALEELVALADDKGVKVVLSGVNVRVYKVLKLVKLASRFSFVS